MRKELKRLIELDREARPPRPYRRPARLGPGNLHAAQGGG